MACSSVSANRDSYQYANTIGHTNKNEHRNADGKRKTDGDANTIGHTDKNEHRNADGERNSYHYALAIANDYSAA
jgi:hypothetical protein